MTYSNTAYEFQDTAPAIASGVLCSPISSYAAAANYRKLIYSSNGTSWTQSGDVLSTLPNGSNYTHFKTVNGVTFGFGYNRRTSITYTNSSPSSAWSSTTVPQGEYFGVEYINGYYCIMGTRFIYSTDLVNWTEGQIPNTVTKNPVKLAALVSDGRRLIAGRSTNDRIYYI
jgi:hypothetical protein